MTYIRMPADLLDDSIIEVASVAQEIAADLQGVLETTESIGNITNQGKLTTFPEFRALDLTVSMDLLDPGVVVGDRGLGYMILELDDVGVGDLFGSG